MEPNKQEIDFREADQRYDELKQQHDAGTLTDEEFDARLKDLMVKDEEGRWWSKSRTTGEWYRYTPDGTWEKDDPPGYDRPRSEPVERPDAAPQGYEPLAGLTAQTGTVYVCPRGDYEWSQQSVGERVPKCPNHEISLILRDRAESGERLGTSGEPHRPWWRRLFG